MGISWTRFTEYDLECDRCQRMETVYTGESYKGKTVCDIPSAIYVADFHRTQGELICGVCFKEKRGKR